MSMDEGGVDEGVRGWGPRGCRMKSDSRDDRPVMRRDVGATRARAVGANGRQVAKEVNELNQPPALSAPGAIIPRKRAKLAVSWPGLLL